MIYTCYEMIQDCRADKPEGWRYFVTQYVPIMRKLLAHYFPERAGDSTLLERVLGSLRRSDSRLFQSLDPAPERAFVAELRQRLLEAVEADQPSVPPEIAIDLATLSEALQPLTMIETQAVWMETMRYDARDAGRILHIDPKTVEKNRERAAELARGKLDAWRRSLLAENGPALGLEAGAASGPDCPPAKTFFDAIDGRITWRSRELLEAHVTRCLHCVDHFCRLLEAVDMLRDSRPLAPAEAARYYQLLGIGGPRQGLWKRVFSR